MCYEIVWILQPYNPHSLGHTKVNFCSTLAHEYCQMTLFSLEDMRAGVTYYKQLPTPLFPSPMNSGAIIQITKKSASGIWEYILNRVSSKNILILFILFGHKNYGEGTWNGYEEAVRYSFTSVACGR